MSIVSEFANWQKFFKMHDNVVNKNELSGMQIVVMCKKMWHMTGGGLGHGGAWAQVP